jgi:hypothetical protein
VRISEAIPPIPICLHSPNGDFHAHELNEISKNVKISFESQYVPILNVITVFLAFILMDPCTVDYSAEIPTRCSFVIEFIIPKFFLETQHFSSGTPPIIRSSELYLLPLVYMPIR